MEKILELLVIRRCDFFKLEEVAIHIDLREFNLKKSHEA